MRPSELRVAAQRAAELFADRIAAIFRSAKTAPPRATAAIRQPASSVAAAAKSLTPTLAKVAAKAPAKAPAKKKAPKASAAQPSQSAASSPPQAPAAPSSKRRPAAEVRALEDRVFQMIAAAPDGLRAKEINAQLGTTSKELERPLTHLLSKGRIRKTGQSSATRYLPA